ncbi:beta-propeller domain-containing protein [Candidatus Poriferisocius sp.]|uniref:beta-propeller domain-containing protein n=1 Tax=Candidatus Poriferisocius sp. TaxID=3101276 RepID=UPI003B01751D
MFKQIHSNRYRRGAVLAATPNRAEAPRSKSNRYRRGTVLAAIALASVLALLSTACSSDSTGSPGITGGSPRNDTATPGEPLELDNVDLLSALRSFEDCNSALEYLRTETVERVGPYGIDDGGFYPGFLDDAVEESVADMAGRESSSQAAATDDSASGEDSAGFSSTNVQVAGVDEPDIIKTDGNRILAVADRQLHYVDLTGSRPLLKGSLKLGDWGWPQEILMHGDRALIFANSYVEGLPPVKPGDLVGPARATDVDFNGTSVVHIQEVDLSEPSDMKVVRELRVDGQYLSARSSGSTAWVSLSSYPLRFQFVRPSGPSAEGTAERVNKEIAAAAELGAWLPAYRLDTPGGQTEAGLLPACENLYVPADFSGLTVLSVITLDMNGPLQAGNAASVLADGHTLYGTGQSLYLATSNLDTPGGRVDERTTGSSSAPAKWTTSIHKFSVSESGPARYEASGEVFGQLLNQFSMDEHDGHFRVATTTGDPFGGSEDSQSQIVVLRQQDRRLEIVGSVGGLGQGERIYSVRYAGDTGYVVTFRETDPLYVLDLSDPTNPSVSGELKIPGFSTYLHPLGNGLLVGIGQQADERGRTQGTKVSLFDVSDPSTPTELDVLVFPGAYSEAEGDHRAFLYWPDEEMLAIPLNQSEPSATEQGLVTSNPAGVSRPDGEKPFSGAVVMRVNSTGLSKTGRIMHRRGAASFPGCRPVINRTLLPDWLSQADELHFCPTGTPLLHPGFTCDTWDEDSVRKEWPELGIRNGEMLLACREWNPGIQRLLVADDALWTMTVEAIQANDMETLEFEHQLFLTRSAN